MRIGSKVYSEQWGILTVSRKKYKALGNKTVFFGLDEHGKEHELTGNEIPASEYKKPEKPIGIEDLVKQFSMLKGNPGKDAQNPVRGVDYFTSEDVKKMVEAVHSMVYKPKDGITPTPGVDYPSYDEIEAFVTKEVAKIPKPKDGINGANGFDGRNGLNGKDGKSGTSIEFKWQGTKLGIKRDDQTWEDVKFVELKGRNGEDGGFSGGNSFTGLAKVDISGTPGTLQEKIIAGSNITVTKVGDTLVVASTGGSNPSDEAYDAATWDGSTDAPTKNAVRDKIEAMLGSSGITRTVTNSSGAFTAGSSASTDYVYFITGAHAVALPTAVSNKNRYTFKNNHSAAITITPDGVETIDGASSIQVAPEDAVDLISNNSNWFVI